MSAERMGMESVPGQSSSVAQSEVVPPRGRMRAEPALEEGPEGH